MNEHMISQWNSVVQDTDIVYNLGDVVFAQDGFNCVRRLKGKKILLMGNHERHKLSKYLDVFDDIRAYHTIDDIIFSHIPVHPSQLDYRFKANVHGHLHNNLVNDIRYLCISVEQCGYTPVSLDEILDCFKKLEVL